MGYMILEIKKEFTLSEKDSERQERINLRLNIKKLPFKISVDNFCSRYVEMFKAFKPLFKYHEGDYALKWCLSTQKRMKVFLLIFEANELGDEIYKENLSSRMPEFSYKTIAQIVDDGISKGYFLKLKPRNPNTSDLKIRNIRPSEDLIVEFINWQIDLISTYNNFQKKYI